MPKTSVDEDGKPSGRKDDVCATTNGWHGSLVLEVSEPSTVQSAPQRNLRPGVAPSISLHNPTNGLRRRSRNRRQWARRS